MGTQRKVSVVGAITNVDIADIQTPATNINNMLGGRIPGVISLQRSGEPGKNISEFWIRGIGTFGANSSALVLIDGFFKYLRILFQFNRNITLRFRHQILFLLISQK